MSVILVILIRLSRKTWGRFLNEAYLRCTYLRGRLHVLAGKEAVHCRDGCSALQGRMQCTAGAVAVHCRSGCSALRLKWVKLAPKSSVLFWTRKGRRDTPHMGHSSPPDLSTEPFCCKLIFHDAESIEIKFWDNPFPVHFV